MPYNPNIHHRRSIRLKGYDYSKAGLYFITICCQNRACLFGKIVGATLVVDPNEVDKNKTGDPNQTSAEMILNDAGQMIEDQWLALPERFPNVVLHQYIVMPNHFHAILEIVGNVGATLVVAQNKDAVAQNEDCVAQNEDCVAQNKDCVAQNKDVVAQNKDVVAQNKDVVAQNNDENETVQPCEIEGQPQGIAPTKTVGDMMDAFKSITTVEYIRGVKNCNWQPFNRKLWQRNYHEHIIRNEQSYLTISNYIINNPAKWLDDKFYETN